MTGLGRFLTTDKTTQHTLKVAESIARGQVPILISGESGSGKKLLAAEIHRRSDRASGALHIVKGDDFQNQGELLASILAGAERATLVLDGVDLMSREAQAALVGFCDQQERERQTRKNLSPKARIIALSRKNLRASVQAGAFRSDLYFRLNGVPITIPPLRERPRDIAYLAQNFADSSAAWNGLPRKALSLEAQDKLILWNWPGNVSELQSVMERAVAISQGPFIGAADLLITDFEQGVAQRNFGPGMTISQVEKNLILQTLEFTRQNRTRAAQLLGISIRTLRNKLQEYRVGQDSFSTTEAEHELSL
jgi:two-component system response regulator FlrC